jgi:hypothetical protein
MGELGELGRTSNTVRRRGGEVVGSGGICVGDIVWDLAACIRKAGAR